MDNIAIDLISKFVVSNEKAPNLIGFESVQLLAHTRIVLKVIWSSGEHVYHPGGEGCAPGFEERLVASQVEQSFPVPSNSQVGIGF